MSVRHLCSAATLLVLAGCGSPPVPPPSAEAGPLEGTWRLAEMRLLHPDGSAVALSPRESFFLFAGGSYSMSWAFGEGPSPAYAERWTPSAEERLARFGSMLVNAGTFTLEEDRMVARPHFAVAPEFVGGEGRFRFAFAGDTLELTWDESLAFDGLPYPGGGTRTLLRLVRIR